MYSAATKRKGPEPTTSVTARPGSVLARRSGMMNSTEESGLASASSSSGKARLSRSVKLRSSVAVQSSVTRASSWPTGSRAHQRRIEAMQSAERTGLPSWKRSPSRSRNRQVIPSEEVSCPSIICGCGRSCASTP